jgi:hypothetical protein
MKNLLLSLPFVYLPFSCFSQSVDTVLVGDETRIVFTADTEADKLRKSGDVYGAIESFRNMYSPGLNKMEIYNYACALSVAYQLDSAFKYLLIATADDMSSYALTDPDFLNLRNDKRWDDFESNLISRLQQNENPIKDIEYAKRLWYMLASDQAYFDCINLAENKIGRHSNVVLALWQLKERINKENQEELEDLIKLKGWPKISNVGVEAASAAFLVIQHSDHEKQKKYIPVIKKLCNEKEANCGSYALMYDRIQTSENKPQKYGSQVRFNEEMNKYELYPLLDETKVDIWRNEVGLGPLANYLAQWDIKFQPKSK